MTDRELLELAAKAIGIDGLPFLDNQYCQGALRCGYWDDLNESCWNPLEDDGDALRLAVTCGIVTQPKCFDEYDCLFASAYVYDDLGMEVCSVREPYTDDPYTATCRAIVRAAAQIGKEKNK